MLREARTILGLVRPKSKTKTLQKEHNNEWAQLLVPGCNGLGGISTSYRRRPSALPSHKRDGDSHSDPFVDNVGSLVKTMILNLQVSAPIAPTTYLGNGHTIGCERLSASRQKCMSSICHLYATKLASACQELRSTREATSYQPASQYSPLRWITTFARMAVVESLFSLLSHLPIYQLRISSPHGNRADHRLTFRP
jgi:hypothetical protein